jgi:hypothetical protein
MGWNSSLIITNEREPGYLGTAPLDSFAASMQLVNAMKIPAGHRTHAAFLQSALERTDGWFTVAAFEGAALIVDAPDLIGTVEDDRNGFIKRFVALHPNATVLAYDLGSGTNYAAYQWFEKSVLKRKAAGDAERGLAINFGTPLEEETEIFNKHPGKEFPYLGESLAFNLCKRFFGCPLDEFDDEKMSAQPVKLLPPFFVTLRKLFRR